MTKALHAAVVSYIKRGGKDGRKKSRKRRRRGEDLGRGGMKEDEGVGGDSEEVQLRCFTARTC